MCVVSQCVAKERWWRTKEWGESRRAESLGPHRGACDFGW